MSGQAASAGGASERGQAGTVHAVMLRLCQAGLSWQDANSIGIEQALCLLAHCQLSEELSFCEAESRRVASLSFVDEHEQRKQLRSLEQRALAVTRLFFAEA